MNEMTTIARTTTLKDWETDQEVRWCPGCGDYAILKAVQRTMPEIGTAPENTVFIGMMPKMPQAIAPAIAVTARGSNSVTKKNATKARIIRVIVALSN